MKTPRLSMSAPANTLTYFFLVATVTLSACSKSPMATVDASADRPAMSDALALETAADIGTLSQPETGALAEVGPGLQVDTGALVEVGTGARPDTGALADVFVVSHPEANLAMDTPAAGLLDGGALVDVSAVSKPEAGRSEAGGSEAGGTAQPEVGSATGAALVVSLGNVNVGTIDLGKSVSGALFVTNVGATASGELTVLPGVGVAVTGCSSALQPGATCTITYTVTPTMVGTFASSISVAADPGATPPLAIKVTGIVVQPGQFSVAPAAIDLGFLPVGVPATPQTITVTTQGALTDLSVLASGPEVKIDATSTCAATLAAGVTCTVVVDFVAASTGSKSDSIVISAGGKTLAVPITAAVGAMAKLAVTPSTAAFAAAVNTSSSAVVFSVANAGDMATGSLSAAITGANAAEFTLAANNCLLLAPMSVCSISIVFAPRTTDQVTKIATLTVTDSGAGASTVKAALNGTAYSPALLTITSDQSDLGTVPIGTTGATTVFTVTNSGDVASGTLAVSVTDPQFAIMSDTCSGSSLAKNGTCTVGLALQPTTVGAKSATIQVAGTSGTPTAKVITGAGIQ